MWAELAVRGRHLSARNGLSWDLSASALQDRAYYRRVMPPDRGRRADAR
jgi:hypothetical protein